MAYRDRAADAKAIAGAISGAKEQVAAAVSGVNNIVDSGRNALNTIIDTVPKVLPGALSAATAALAKVQYSGTTGNFDSALQPIVLELSYYAATEDNSANIGSPCYKNLLLSGLRGFCKCEHPYVALECTEYERQTVHALLERGVYIE